MNVIGEVEGKSVILIDDIIDTAGTVCNAADIMMEKGPRKYLYAAPIRYSPDQRWKGWQRPRSRR